MGALKINGQVYVVGSIKSMESSSSRFVVLLLSLEMQLYILFAHHNLPLGSTREFNVQLNGNFMTRMNGHENSSLQIALNGTRRICTPVFGDIKDWFWCAIGFNGAESRSNNKHPRAVDLISSYSWAPPLVPLLFCLCGGWILNWGITFRI